MINRWPPALLTFGAILLGIAGCGGSDDPSELDGREVARALAKHVRGIDGGRLNLSCKPRPTEFEDSTPWECKGTWSKGGVTDFVTYSTVVGENGKILSFVTEP